ncbi:hypothetical protein QP185_19005 [Sphingomonas aerolata]|uniref:hypothetical protein n=1 Tax=Sphingomonas aerolata TaxID=185951 RepID=UPI002FE1EAB4
MRSPTSFADLADPVRLFGRDDPLCRRALIFDHGMGCVADQRADREQHLGTPDPRPGARQRSLLDTLPKSNSICDAPATEVACRRCPIRDCQTRCRSRR